MQIATSINEKSPTPGNFRGVHGVERYRDGQIYKYHVGRTTDLESAKTLQTKMKENGFRDAFVIALANGQRISISKAQQLLE
ncbi:MAG: hypothetical protein U5L96_11315 [Owenweeksia sp.]|nr:hypothetical protein [Owenweeksia sp.]